MALRNSHFSIPHQTNLRVELVVFPVSSTILARRLSPSYENSLRVVVHRSAGHIESVLQIGSRYPQQRKVVGPTIEHPRTAPSAVNKQQRGWSLPHWQAVSIRENELRETPPAFVAQPGLCSVP